MAANGTAEIWWLSCTFLSQCITEGPVGDETVSSAVIIFANELMLNLGLKFLQKLVK